jgi:2-oxoglutarate dehydrogenase E2 component (dihydrolipoamide succinyltransferase)
VKPAYETAHEVDEGPAAPPSVRRLLREHHLRAEDVPPSGDRGRLLREDVLRYAHEHKQQPAAIEKQPPSIPGAGPPALATAPAAGEEPTERAVPMSLLRRRIAERLVAAQQNAALLTTFNEIDMSEVAELRSRLRDAFQEKYGVKLGILSFFVKATVEALREFPAVNAEIRGTDVVYRDAFHIGIAIGAKRGLVVPVLRDADRLSFAEIEQGIDDFARRAETNKLDPGDLTGGTFTISNGGIYGSLLSTPIVNPPQSGVLGLHAIQQRPVAVDGQVVIRPMMYVALTYDHRLIDGREAVTFLRRIKETVESPARLLIGV